MPVRGTMASLIARVRLMINDPAGGSQIWADQDVQNVLDESRADLYNYPLTPQWTFSGTTPIVLDYFAPSQLGDWEDDIVLKQFLTVTVTPSATDDIVGHWTFAASTLPPVFITGKTFDIYRAAADLLERWAAKWTLLYTISIDGQHLRPNMAADALQKLAKTFRMKQRARSITMTRSDLSVGERAHVGLDAQEIDRMGSG